MNEPQEQEKSYYEKLREKTGSIDYSDYKLYSSGSNGFYAKERKFGYIVCTLFLAILLFSSLFGVISFWTRERELTEQNYKEYFTIDVQATEIANWDSFEVLLIPKENMYTIHDFSATIEIIFKKIGYNEVLVKEVNISNVAFTKDDVLKGAVALGEIGYVEIGVRVLSVSGGM
ncbi:MAG: hypothetical protein J6B56_03490 [Clostridia bacterium]|nr:hypothetical protein [Clostridia bacterium]